MAGEAKRTYQKRKAAERDTLPTRFSVRYLKDVDCRTSRMKEFKRRLDVLKKATGATSPQKILLCERANYLATKLQTMELDDAEGRPINHAVYVQLCNTFDKLLSKLGLDDKGSKKNKQTLNDIAQGDD